MYPSGNWRGYWEQLGWGRQPMNDLVLHFEAGTVEGRGVDIIGPFTFQGEYAADGSVTLYKRYANRTHTVAYHGFYDGEGTIYGRWMINEHNCGPFALSPCDFDVAADAPILTISARPGPAR